MEFDPAQVELASVLLEIQNAPATREQLADYIETLTMVPCPRVGFEGQDSPADMAWDMWMGRPTVTVASRGSYKTLVTTAAEFLISHYQEMDYIHFAAGEDQVNTAQNYFRTYSEFDWWRDHVSNTKEEIVFGSGGLILPRVLSRKNARSKHRRRTVNDESDELDPIHYRAAINIPDGRMARASMHPDPEVRKRAREEGEFEIYSPAATHHISTQQRAHGIVATLRAKAKENGRKLFAWNFKTVTERCNANSVLGTADAFTRGPRGSERVQLWINRNTHQRQVAEPLKPKGWERREMWNGCEACALAASCRGDLDRAHGTRTIDDLYAKLTDPLMTPDEWTSQQENLQPSRRGLAVPEWNHEAQVRALQFDPELPHVLAVDFSGGEHLAVILALQRIPIEWPMLRPDGTRDHGYLNRNPKRVHVFDELTKRGAEFAAVMCPIWTEEYIPIYGRPAHIVADPSQLGNNRAAPIGKGTIRMQDADNNHQRGYRALRSLCVPSQEDDEPGLFVDPKCIRTIHEMSTVRKKLLADGSYSDEIEKKDDDALDACRYGVLFALTMAGHSRPVARAIERKVSGVGPW